MNSIKVSTSFATDRRTSSGSAFYRGGDALPDSRASSARNDSSSCTCRAARGGVEARGVFAVFFTHSSGANANGGHGPLTATRSAPRRERTGASASL